MQYDAKTPSEYIHMLNDDWKREKLQKLRTIIKSKAPNITESIHYKMLSYGDKNTTLLHLNAQKHYVSLYVGNIKKIDPSGKLLKNLNIGKGCIRFKKNPSLSNTGIEQFIEQAIQRWEKKAELQC